MKDHIPGLASLAALVLLAACGSGQSNQRYYASQNGQWVEISKSDYQMVQSTQAAYDGPPALTHAIDRNTPTADLPDLSRTPLTELTQDQIADLSVAAARDICGIPDGQPITPETPCNF